MRTLILIALVGLAAQLVDGGLGMAYGVTTSTLLLMIGANPAAASATVHLAEVGTTLASGISHWRFGNVDWRVVAKIGIPGAAGGFLGATVLSNLDASVARPVMSTVLLILGVYILWRFTFKGLRKERLGRKIPARFLSPLGLFAGFIDATGGGGWGPVGTPALLADGRLEPRKVVGSVNTAEFMVTVAASLGFLIHLGGQGINFAWVGALLIGGVIAAPIAAALVKVIPARVLGPAVGGLIVLTNLRTLLSADALNAPAQLTNVVYIAVALVWIAAVVHAARAHRRERDTRRVVAGTGDSGQSSLPADERDEATVKSPVT
ncbi:sulfite exporter TauE/SafE family protein [Kocuria coralli]|uniref:Probable membrane transporter protein n=1 Tax=Kocuria coralli TaxID=1461025 RepID=A0A5J5L0X5_9MICC|nr:sulfite exporter TauE/SafE family protein [Kocuria coralli]KAA9395288.1 sulfite exporter TauE/SafE family protein [Kocuria coralli]